LALGDNTIKEVHVILLTERLRGEILKLNIDSLTVDDKRKALIKKILEGTDRK
jgi:hypothetical protein